MSTGRWSLDYVRNRYRVPARRRMRVVVDGRPGVITCGDGAHIRVRFDGERFSRSCHPTWRFDYGDGRDYSAEHDARVEAVYGRLNRAAA